MSSNPILQTISRWFGRTFSDPEAISLFMTILVALLLLEFFGAILMPVFVSIVFAYLLNSVVKFLQHWRWPRLLAVWVTFILFLSLFIYAFVYVGPLLWRQLVNLVNEMPVAFTTGQVWLDQFIRSHNGLISAVQLEHVISYLKEQSPKVGQSILHISFLAIPNLAELILYLVLVPLLVFFFLKDSRAIIGWLKKYLPQQHTLVDKVYREAYDKMGCYVKGRVIEILIIGIVAAVAFTLLGMPYSVLLGALVGLSVIVPYIGAIIVTIPVVIVALMQWGITAHFWYLVFVYAAIIAVDGNILFPLLFAQTMELHPVVIIVSVLFFGGIWGFWGVFFAIPLATLVDVVLKAWPKSVD